VIYSARQLCSDTFGHTALQWYIRPDSSAVIHSARQLCSDTFGQSWYTVAHVAITTLGENSIIFLWISTSTHHT